MIDKCRNRKNLENCFFSEKEDYWFLNDCVDQTVDWNSREIPFCVKSPAGQKIHLASSGVVSGALDLLMGISLTSIQSQCSIIETKGVQYLFALDLTPTKPFPIEDLEVFYSEPLNNYQILTF